MSKLVIMQEGPTTDKRQGITHNWFGQGKERIMKYQEGAASAQREGNARRGFYIHLTAYLVVNALLVCISFATTTKYLWFKWPLLGWGVGILAPCAPT